MIYIIGSLRNPLIPKIGDSIRALGLQAFDMWHAAGPEADDYWRDYHRERGNSYKDALASPEADNVFNFDKKHLDMADMAILVMPAGKSAHLEAGYMIGQGKKVYILFDEEPERYDVMVKFATAVFFNEEDLVNELSRANRQQASDARAPVAEPYEYRGAMVGISGTGDPARSGRMYDGAFEDSSY